MDAITTDRPSARVTRTGLVLIAAATLTGLAVSEIALAHAALARAVPAPGSTVTAAPRVVRLWFRLAGEELDPTRSAVSVWDRRGKRVDDGRGGVDLDDLDRLSMIARLTPIGPGTYTVRWTAVSTPDGSIAQGRFRFNVAKR